MPTPREGESRDDFVSRCIPIVLDEGTAESQDQAVAICNSMWEDKTVPEGNALKAIREDDETLTVANYIVLFGGRDLEGLASPYTNADGTKGQYFAPDTDLSSSYTATGTLHVDWEHGRGKGLDGDDAPGRNDILGIVDWKSVRVDDRGVWVERVLQRRNKYMQFLETLIREGLIGTSSEPVQGDVAFGDDGKITRWPLRRDSLTVQPMEPRMISSNALAALKSLAAESPSVKALLEEADLEPEAESGEDSAAEGALPPTERKHATQPKPELDPKEDTMGDKEKTTPEAAGESAPEAAAPLLSVDTEALAQAMQPVLKTALEAVDERWEKRLEEIQPARKSGGWYITEGRADRALQERPYKSLGEFLLDVAAAGGMHGPLDERLLPLRSKDPLDENGFDLGKALGPNYVGSLTQASMRAKAPTGLQTGVPSEGGFLVGTDMAPGILARVYQVGQVISRVSMTGISANSNSMTFHAEDESSRKDGYRRGGIRAYWTAEAGEMTASQPKFRDIDLKLKKVTGLVYATDELLADAGALESWITTNLPEELRFVVEDAVINGDGVGKPQGIVNSGALITVSAETGQDAGTIVAQNVMNMWARRWTPANDYIWLVNQDTGPQLWQMELPVGTGGIALYQPPGGLSATPYATLMGRPVIEVEYCETVGTEGDILLVSLNQFQMIEKGGIESASSMHVRFVYGENVFRFIYRCDGESLWNAPLTPYKGTNTVSPYLSLATRS